VPIVTARDAPAQKPGLSASTRAGFFVTLCWIASIKAGSARGGAGPSLAFGFRAAGAGAGGVGAAVGVGASSSPFSLLVSIGAGGGVTRGGSVTARGGGRGAGCSTERLSMSTTAVGSAEAAAGMAPNGKFGTAVALGAALTGVGDSESGWRRILSARTRNAPEPEAAMQISTAMPTDSQRGCCPRHGYRKASGKSERAGGIGDERKSGIAEAMGRAGGGGEGRAGTGVAKRAGVGMGLGAGPGLGARDGPRRAGEGVFGAGGRGVGVRAAGD
jgi:hypothetical protein